MVNWRPPFGMALIVVGFGLFALGGLHDVWWSWLLGVLAALVGGLAGLAIFFSGLLEA